MLLEDRKIIHDNAVLTVILSNVNHTTQNALVTSLIDPNTKSLEILKLKHQKIDLLEEAVRDNQLSTKADLKDNTLDATVVTRGSCTPIS